MPKNADLMRSFQRVRVYGSCATQGAQGDFIAMASRVGAALGNMAGAWHNEVILEQVLVPEYQNELIWVPPGDSMIYVNRYGERVVDELRPYCSRSRVHDTYDPVREEYPNHLLFMIFDRRTVDQLEERPIRCLGLEKWLRGSSRGRLSMSWPRRLPHI